MAKRFALIGERLGHSYSVPIHERFFSLTGVRASYVLHEIAQQHFAQVGAFLRTLDGANVTIPYKEKMIPLLDEAHAEAINTVVNCKGRLIGTNTDSTGFEQMMVYHGFEVAGKDCAILGAGGAAKAAKEALERMQANSVTVFSRTPDTKEGTASYQMLENMKGGLLVNCTPVGMHPFPDDCPVSKTVLLNFDAVCDMIYNPSETQLTLQAKAFGKKTATGLYMLVAQAAAAQTIWLDTAISKEMIQTVYKEMKK